MTDTHKACSGCQRTGMPLVVATDERELCLACAEASGAAAGLDEDALALLRWLTQIAEQQRS